MIINNKIFSFLLLGLFIVIGLLFLIFGIENVLHHIWNIPPMQPTIPETPYFADIRHIIGANESLAQGLDPLVENPGDPWGRTLTYPRIWQYFSELFQLKQTYGNYFGFINIILFVTGLLLFTSNVKLSVTTVVLILLAALSPASILGMERGNIDMFLFFTFSLALFYISKPVVFTLIILLASILKVFPIFVLAGLIKLPKWNFIKIIAISTLIFSVYILFIIDDLRTIDMMMPQLVYLSHGMNIIWMTADKVFSTEIGLIFKVTTYLYLAGLGILNLIYIIKLENYTINTTYIDSFRIGSALFIGTFLLNNNLDYRLIFLIFTIPQLIIWIKLETNTFIKIASLLSIILALYSMWYLQINRVHFEITWIMDELTNWILFSSLFFLFMRSLPTWVLDLISYFGSDKRQPLKTTQK